MILSSFVSFECVGIALTSQKFIRYKIKKLLLVNIVDMIACLRLVLIGLITVGDEVAIGLTMMGVSVGNAVLKCTISKQGQY